MTISKREGLSFVQYESDGVNRNFPFSFTYLDRAFIFVRVGSVLTTDFTFVNSNEIRLNTAAPSGVIVTISRITDGEEKLVDFQDSGIITEKLLDTEFDQVMNLVQEAKDVANSSVFIDIDTMTGDAGFARLINVGDATDPQDAMNKRTTEAMFSAFETEFNTKLTEIQAIEDNVESIETDTNATKIDFDNKYTEIQGIATTMTSQVAQAEAAKVAAQVAQGAAEAASTSAAGYATAASTSADEAELARDQAQDIADGLGPISTEFPAVKASVEQLEIDVSDLQVTSAGHTSAIADINTDIATLETQMSDTVRLTATQTVTNKTLAGSSIVNPTRTDVKSDTYNNLVTYATTATDGQTVFAYDLGKFYGVVGGLLKDLGGGGSGSLDTIKQFNATETLTDWSTVMTNSTFVKTTTNPLHGNESYLFTTGASEVAIINTPQIPIDLKFRGKLIAFKIPYLCSTASKFSMSIWDTTSTAVKIGSDSVFEAETVNVKSLTKVVYIPQGCTQVKVQIVANTGTAGHTLKFDDIDIGSNLTEAIVAKFDNNAYLGNFGPIVITAATTNPTKGATSQDTIDVYQNGSLANILYTLKTTTGWTAGSGYYKFRLPIVNGVQLEFDDSIAVSANVGSGNILLSSGANVATSSCALIKDSSTTFSASCDASSTDGVSLISPSWHSLSNANIWYTFNVNARIKQWSSQTNAAIVACKEGPLKCTNKFEVTVDGTAATTGLNIPNWITCANTATGIKTCTFNAGMGLVNKMNCFAGFGSDGNGESAAGYIQITNQTNTGVTVRTYTTAAVAGNYTVKMSCGKTGNDIYNVDSTVTPLSDMNDVKSTEWVVGYDHISNKPIYKRCFTSTPATGSTIISGVSKMVGARGSHGWTSSTLFILFPQYSSGTDHVFLEKDASNNILIRKAGAGNQTAANLCIEYTKI